MQFRARFQTGKMGCARRKAQRKGVVISCSGLQKKTCLKLVSYLVFLVVLISIISGIKASDVLALCNLLF